MNRIALVAFILITVCPCFSSGPACAQDQLWAPPPPSEKEKDWIKTSSGEWLWGTIKLMRDESLQFDSEELDEVTIDWADIAEIRSSRVMTYVMTDGNLLAGTAVFKNDLLQVNTNKGLQGVSRQQIHSILEGKPTEINYWSLNVGADLIARGGNTNQKETGGRIFIRREAARSRIDLRYQGNYSKVDDIETVRNNRLNAEWKLFLSRRFFLTPIKGELYQDKFKNIDMQSTISAGVGYFLNRNSKADWFVELGGGYQKTQYVSVEPGEADSESNGSIPFRTTLETDLTKTIELDAEYGIQIGIGHEANTIQHTFILFEIDIIGNIDLSTSFTWDHVSQPKTNAEGITPKKDDVTLAFGLSIDL
jgi:putative salt-induced outer membrane protein YdiY